MLVPSLSFVSKLGPSAETLHPARYTFGPLGSSSVCKEMSNSSTDNCLPIIFFYAYLSKMTKHEM